jgi:hypothetical protein
MTLAKLSRRVGWRGYIYGVAAAAALVGIAFLLSTPKVYSVQGDISFSPPDEVVATAPFASYVETMIGYTAAVDRLYKDTYPTTQLSSPTASLFGNGVHEGVSVGISTVGSQWRVGVDRPVIVVKVNAPSQTQAMEDLTRVLRQVEALSIQLQEDTGVPVAQRIQTTWDEGEITVESVNSTKTGVVKGAAVLMVVALLFAGLAASAVDAIQRHGRRRGAGIPQSVHRGPRDDWVRHEAPGRSVEGASP